MSYIVRFRRAASRYLKRLAPRERRRILAAIAVLAADPDDPTLDVKKLQHRAGYRLRIGGVRIIYERKDEELVIIVVKVGPRGDAYKG